MLVGITIDIVVGLVMALGVANIVIVFVAETKQRSRQRDLRDAQECRLRYQGA